MIVKLKSSHDRKTLSSKAGFTKRNMEEIVVQVKTPNLMKCT